MLPALTLNGLAGARDDFGPIDLELARGESLGLCSRPIGSARSLFATLAGRIPATAGLACLDGAPIAGPGFGSIRRDPAPRPDPRRIGLACPDDPLLPHLDVAGNVALPMRVVGMSRAAISARTAEILAWLGLEPAASLRPRALDAETASRVRIARALAATPRLLLVADPARGLAPQPRAALLARLRRLQQARELTMMLATDEADEAFGFGDRAGLISGEKLWQCDPPTILLDAPRHAIIARTFGAANLLPGQVIAHEDDTLSLRLASGASLDGVAATDATGLAEGAACEVAIRPDRLAVAFVDRLPASPEHGDLPATLLDAQHLGERLRLRFRLADGSELIAHRPPNAIRGRLERDRPALLACQARDAIVFPQG